MQRAENNSYEFEARVRYSEIGHRGTMTLPALINYFQDCSTFRQLFFALLAHIAVEWVLNCLLSVKCEHVMNRNHGI